MSRRHREALLDDNSAGAFKRMRPADRVRMAVEMTDAVSAITLQSILDRNPGIFKRDLIAEARKRFMVGRRRHWKPARSWNWSPVQSDE